MRIQLEWASAPDTNIQHLATNRFSEYTSMVLIGLHERPLDQIAAEIRCAREFAGESAAAETHEKKLRLFHYRAEDGGGAGRWMNAQPDPDVQAAIEADYSANIIQAIGRLRTALRLDEAPIQFLILCNEPVTGLEIQELATINEVVNTKRTYPPKTDESIYKTYMECPEKEGLVLAFTAVDSGEAEADPWLTQDETRETQDFALEELAEIWGEVEILE